MKEPACGKRKQLLERPLLITGCARSGTSALAHALSTHHRFCIFKEYHLYYQSEYPNNIWHRIRGMRGDNPPPDNISSDTEALRSRLLEELPSPTPCQTTRKWLFELNANPLDVYGDKMPWRYLADMHEIADRYPEAKFLVTLRDGRDVVVSQLRHHASCLKNGLTPEHWMQPTVEKAEYLWLRSARAWLELGSEPPAPCLELRYEQAAQSPEIVAKNICDFVGTAYREEDFGEFFEQYRPVRIDASREEIDDIEGQLSAEFVDALGRLGYE